MSCTAVCGLESGAIFCYNFQLCRCVFSRLDPCSKRCCNKKEEETQIKNMCDCYTDTTLVAFFSSSSSDTALCLHTADTAYGVTQKVDSCYLVQEESSKKFFFSSPTMRIFLVIISLTQVDNKRVSSSSSSSSCVVVWSLFFTQTHPRQHLFCVVTTNF
jgi:hypothetical protein